MEPSKKKVLLTSRVGFQLIALVLVLAALISGIYLSHDSLLILLLVSCLVICIVIIYERRHVAYIIKLVDYLNGLNTDVQPRTFSEKAPGEELEVLRVAINSAAEKNYMQSVAVKQSFDELSRFSMMLEFSPALIVTLNTELHVTYINRSFKNTLPEKFQDRDVLEVLPDDISELVSNCILDNRIFQGQESVVRGRNYAWSIVPMPAQTEVNCFGVDITELRKAESETESAYVDSMMARDESEAKSIFLANMSHEIRTPLTAILGFSEALLDTSQPMEERVAGINTIIRNAQHLLSIINDLLDITKIESGLSIVNLQSVSLKSIIEDVCNTYAAQARLKGIKFNLDIHYPVPEFVISDGLRLRQILFNICSNAIKFTDLGRVKFQVMFDRHSDELTFIISDTGIGMRADELERIFKRFEQSDTGHSRKYGGSGLGLYICHELVERLGGSITVKSEPGQGSEFRIVVNAEVDPETEFLNEEFTVDTAITATELDRKQYSGHVLLVEDNIDNQNLIKMYLTRLGASVELADNGQEAVDKAGAGEFDLILMDMQMPVMDGVEATKNIIKSGNSTPVIMLTANAMNDDIQLCLEAGCKKVLVKPIQRYEFEKKIIHYLKPASEKKHEDEPIVSDLVNEGPEFYNLVKMYVNQLPDDLEKVLAAYNDEDDDLLKKRIHTMKGTSGNMGFLECSQLCAKVEFAITKNDRDEISQLLQKLEVMKQRILAGVSE